MRERFKWYLSPNQDEMDEIWGKGFLTVDANVLLDLYRYHEQTREQLLKAIEAWAGRVWISDQAAEEFFRNRRTVITSAEKTFREATSSIDDISKAVATGISQLRGHRLVPRNVIDQFETKIGKVVSDVTAEIESARDAHPNHLQGDEILERILTLFDGCVGSPLKEEERRALNDEAEKRKVEKIPPGYLDDDKEGGRAYGDFFLWRQTLDFSKMRATPIVLVTSERKEDWWEKQGGKRVAPRPELLREAATHAQQRVMIYQTDHFLEISLKRGGREIDAESVEEIRQISALRSAPAVKVWQNTLEAGPKRNIGYLTIELLRPVPSFTGSGHFEPNMDFPPDIDTNILKMPENVHFLRHHASTGTVFDFNVHVAGEKGELLPIGEYVVAYEAECAAGGDDIADFG